MCFLLQRSICSVLSGLWSASHLNPGKAWPLQNYAFLLFLQWQSCVSCCQPLWSHLFFTEAQDSSPAHHRSRIGERPPHTDPQTHPQVLAHLCKSFCYSPKWVSCWEWQYLDQIYVCKSQGSMNPKPQILQKRIEEVEIGTFKSIATVRETETVYDALSIFVERRVSALPVVNEQGT